MRLILSVVAVLAVITLSAGGWGMSEESVSGAPFWEDRVVLVPEGAAHFQFLRWDNPGVELAFPAGNCGAWVGLEPDVAGAAVVEQVMPLTSRPEGFGVEAVIRLNTSKFFIGPLGIGSAQEMEILRTSGAIEGHQMVVDGFAIAFAKLTPEQRTALEGQGITPERVARGLVPSVRSVQESDGRVLHLDRAEYMGDRSYHMELVFPSECQVLMGRKVRVSCPGRDSVPMKVRSFTPYPARLVLDPAVVFPAADGRGAGSADVAAMWQRRIREAREALGLLASPDGVLWASPGSMVFKASSALRTLRAIVDHIPTAGLEPIIKSTMLHVTADGRVLSTAARGNEVWLYLIGQATALIQDGRGDEAVSLLLTSPPLLPDESDLESSFLLAPLVRDLVVSTERTAAEKSELLGAKDRSRVERLAANLEWVLRSASSQGHKAFGLRMDYVPKWLPEGTWGPYSARLNLVMIPSALASVGDIMSHPLADELGLKNLDAEKYPLLRKLAQDPAFLDGLLDDYEALNAVYKVHLPLPHARSRVNEYLNSLEGEEKAYYETLVLSPGCIVKQFVKGACVPAGLEDGLRFPASFLDENGKPIALMGVWLAERWIDAPLASDVLEQDLNVLSLPFPLGLMTTLGPVQWNPLHIPAGQRGAWMPGRPIQLVRAEAGLNWCHRGVFLQLDFARQGKGSCGTACDDIGVFHEVLEKAEDGLRNNGVPATSLVYPSNGTLEPVMFSSTYVLPAPGEVPLSRVLYAPSLLDEGMVRGQ